MATLYFAGRDVATSIAAGRSEAPDSVPGLDLGRITAQVNDLWDAYGDLMLAVAALAVLATCVVVWRRLRKVPANRLIALVAVAPTLVWTSHGVWNVTVNALGMAPGIAVVLFTIAGSSCSGKTTAARACARLGGLVVHDFDEIGVPSTADVRWRQRSLERWLRRVLGYQNDGLDVVLLGQSPLGEVLASPSATHLARHRGMPAGRGRRRTVASPRTSRPQQVACRRPTSVRRLGTMASRTRRRSSVRAAGDHQWRMAGDGVGAMEDLDAR